jgi:hypothetical protein
LEDGGDGGGDMFTIAALDTIADVSRKPAVNSPTLIALSSIRGVSRGVRSLVSG